MKSIITCAGYHGTGSSIITDLLQEFEGIKSFGEWEFRFLQDPNGIGDLEEKLINNNARLNSDRAIYDFKKFMNEIATDRDIRFWKKNIYEKTFNGKFMQITQKYLDDIIDLKWQGIWHDIYKRKEFTYNKYIFYISLILMKLKLRKSPKIKTTEIYFSYPITNFIEKTQKYLNQLFEATETIEDTLVFDQLVPICNQKKYLKYFNDLKIVNVDRDPRDLYILNKIYWKDKVVPTDNVEVFIRHFLLIREHKKYENINNDRVKNVKFEDFIYRYNESLQELLDFLKIDKKKHIKKKEYFNPSISINNTQIFKLHPELKSDIKKIEDKLKDYCYDFKEINIDNKRKIF